MAITNASRLADFSSGIGTQGAIIQVDNANQRVGIGTTNPQATLQVGTGVTIYGNSGIVSATKFYGDGSGLSGAGSALEAASGSQRLVVTSLTSGTMTSAATDADLSWNSTTNTLSATNVSIAGTLTYEDVTNVDSIGVVTARSGIRIGAGESIGPVSGTVYYYGDGSNLSNTGSTLSAASGTQRVVVTSQTSGTMTASATDADITFNAGNNTLYVGTGNSTFLKGGVGGVGVGTTTSAGRDAGIGTAAGTVIFNNDADGGTGQLEVYTGKGWVGVTSEAKTNSFIATGGDVEALSPGNGFIYHTFTSSGSFVVSTGSKTADIFVVGPGGGGAGGNGSSGGGGGGGIVLLQNYTLVSGTYTVTIPSGGAGGVNESQPGATGGDTTVTHPQPLSLTAKGGGGGDNWGSPGTSGLPGGSGGGGGGPGAGSGGIGIQPAQPQTNSTGTITQYGNNGGSANPTNPGYRGGGGGGAGAQGQPGSPDNSGGAGGNGNPFPAFNGPLIGVPTVGPNFAGGGGGGNETPLGGGSAAGGAGGGGPSGNPYPDAGDNGTANSGGGGGAGTYGPAPGSSGGTGGKGIVVFRYPA